MKGKKPKPEKLRLQFSVTQETLDKLTELKPTMNTNSPSEIIRRLITLHHVAMKKSKTHKLALVKLDDGAVEDIHTF